MLSAAVIVHGVFAASADEGAAVERAGGEAGKPSLEAGK